MDSTIKVTLMTFPGIEIIKKEFEGELPVQSDITLS